MRRGRDARTSAAPGAPGRSRVRTGRSDGFTLVELLVAILLAALVSTALLFQVRGSARAAAIVGDRAEAGQTGALAASLLRFELERAGRALDEGGLQVVLDPDGVGGDVFLVRYRAEAHRAEPVEVDAAFFAAADAQGRPNLYRRPHDGVRQPWLLGVGGLHVVAGIAPDGGRVEREALAGTAAWSGLLIEVRPDEGEAVSFIADLSRAGEVRTEPAP